MQLKVKFRMENPSFLNRKGKYNQKKYDQQEKIAFLQKQKVQQVNLKKKLSIKNQKTFYVDQSCETDVQIKFEEHFDKRQQKNLNFSLNEETKPLKLSKAQINFRQNLKKKIEQSNYPQNVMKKVHPVQQEYKRQIQDQKQKPKKINIIEDLYSQFQKPKESQFVPSFNQHKQKYQYVEWSNAEHFTIIMNLKWLAFSEIYRVIQNENRSFKQSSLYNEEPKFNFTLDKSQMSTKLKIRQYILELKCLLRYRHIKQINNQLKQIICIYYEHNEPFGIGDIFNQYDILNTLGYELAQFLNLIMKKFIQLTVSLTQRYQFSCNTNKQYIQRLVDIRKDQDKMKKTEQEERNKEKQMLEEQGIFKPYFKVAKYLEYQQQISQNVNQEELKRNQNKCVMNKYGQIEI